MLAILKRLIAHRNIKIAFHRTEQRQPLPISPKPIKQLLYYFLRKLFSTGYTVLSEMVATDRKENNVAIIPGKMAFHQKDAFYDKVDEYWSEDFWDSYNIIEPTESLENAVHKLKKQSR